MVKPGGRAAFIASGGKGLESPRPEVTSLRPAVGRDREHLDRIAELVGKGVLRAPEIKTYPLSEAEAAQRVSEGRHFRGKLILKVK